MTAEQEICSWRTTLSKRQAIINTGRSIKWAVTHGERRTVECPSHAGWRGRRKEAALGTSSSSFPRSLTRSLTLFSVPEEDEGEGGGEGGAWIVAKVLLTLSVFVFLQEDDSSYLQQRGHLHNWIKNRDSALFLSRAIRVVSLKFPS